MSKITSDAAAGSSSTTSPGQEVVVVGSVQIKSTCSHLLKENSGRIAVLFSARLQGESAVVGCGAAEGAPVKQRSSSSKEATTSVFLVLAPRPISSDRTHSTDFIHRLQKYVDDICKEGCGVGGDDSSYDSDYEADSSSTTTSKQHQDVSRTTSDTLAAEYADYVQNDASPGYTARVEFALKLGYTEKLVQAALLKLGPTPAQNELLAELIKLGAQRGISNDSSPTDGPSSSPETIADQQQQQNDSAQLPALKPIVIDGSNVAMSHGNKEVFSCRGIKIAVEWFRARGHKDITVFVPKWRKESPRPDNPIQDQDILAELERERLLVFTPSRLVGGKRMVCYDDRYILKLAAEVDGIVVSNDNYRDLCQESAEFRKVVEERILMYSFVNDRFMPPDDPLGRAGPTLSNFLKTLPKKSDPPPLCPYGKKCTYGNKCKYNHPERGPLPHKSVTERLSEHAQRHLQARELGEGRNKMPLSRTRSNVPPPKEQVTHTAVSKSRSVDNVALSSYQQQQQQCPSASENLHRKLQRQLTLNPNADPRLRRLNSKPPLQPLFCQQQQVGGGNNKWEMHQNVTRIASAPDSYRPWPPKQQQQNQQHVVVGQSQQQHMMQRMSSCSDPQLNIWTPAAAPQPQQQQFVVGQQQQQQQEGARRKLHYHLAAIFPEEQVAHVMHLLPDETNPQKICAAILNMFPKQG